MDGGEGADGGDALMVGEACMGGMGGMGTGCCGWLLVLRAMWPLACNDLRSGCAAEPP